ncbi:PhzF family phenazine biosynthesis protein [Listeria grandensis FSL F6-0971]|uniref:PhzF family phenazine biosynthesis protein n=1 Tax=Listeria grandensis FSL F6-0971 TaxID=1265819 RepID=W7BTC0_9LIST|nr:PhzF family phenazine biosynthesis isomerase [Listeria grandensis]EUJ23598.1 PhzF family phenazine biosynthesis protein [Listeria grandensis FSL F6-0971]
MQVYRYDAFSHVPNRGNPAGVLLEADKLTGDEMQEIAKAVGFNETAFVLQSDIADIRLRYFTPGHEMNLCGHGTMAAIYALYDQHFWTEMGEMRVETKAGILTVKTERLDHGQLEITMEQATPAFKLFSGSHLDLAEAIGIEIDDLSEEWPIMYGSTGVWTLLVPIKNRETFQKMKPDNARFPEILKEIPRASVHPFCLETIDPKATMHARHFSSPFSGTIEDPVTGTASGVMGAYYATYISPDFKNQLNIMVEQGTEVGRDGKVIVHVHKREATYEIKITGTAVYVESIGVSIQR